MLHNIDWVIIKVVSVHIEKEVPLHLEMALATVLSQVTNVATHWSFKFYTYYLIKINER